MNILDSLKIIKSFIKEKGSFEETYGLVFDNILYLQTENIKLSLPVEIPFNGAIKLHDLFVILNTIKNGYILVQKENELLIDTEGNFYKIPYINQDCSLSILELPTIWYKTDFKNLKEFSRLAVKYLEIVRPPQKANYVTQCLNVINGSAVFSDRKNIFECALPEIVTMSISTNTLINFNKLYKFNVIEYGYNGFNLYVKYENGLIACLPIEGSEGQCYSAHTTLLNALNKYWKQPSIELPEYLIKQLLILFNLTKNKSVFFNNHFCSTNEQRIDYENTGADFQIKVSNKNLTTIIEYVKNIDITENRLSLLNTEFMFRGVMAGIEED